MIQGNIKNIELKFETSKEIFSPASIDIGTLAMLSVVEFCRTDKVLDLGCGYGVVGILAAKTIGEEKVIMCDISEEAIKASKRNADINGVAHVDIRLSDAYENIFEEDFTIILSNPPYHTDFSVAKTFIQTGYKKLVTGGKMVMVTKRLGWYKNKLTSVFGGVKVYEINGYYVFVTEKRCNNFRKSSEKPQQKLSKKLQRKYDRSKYTRF